MRTRQTALHSSASTPSGILHIDSEKQEEAMLSSATCMNKPAFAAI